MGFNDDYTLRIMAERLAYIQVIDLFFSRKSRDGRVEVMKDFSFEPLVLDGELRHSGIRISYDVAQQLVDELWNCGIRPTEGAGSAGSMKAAEANLKDMRDVVDRLFGLLERK